MGRYDRLIKLAYDRLSDTTWDADNLFDTTKNGFEIRKQASRNEFDFYCKECLQSLEVSTSKYDRLHFRHKKGAAHCILKDEDLSPEEQEKFTQNLRFKESDRHKILKNRIGVLLQDTKGVDRETICIDNKFIIRGEEKRRPDVYCIFEGKEIIFEIQLSNLSLRYILSRYDFYKTHGMYLIWILDDFDIHGQGQMERDIKYLNDYQNFFKLDESKDNFSLICDYKYVLLTNDNTIITPWTKKSITLSDLNFNESNFQAYYYDLEKHRAIKDRERFERIIQLKEEEQKRLREKMLLKARDKASEIKEHIRHLRKIKSQNFAGVSALINDLSDFDVPVLNQVIAISETHEGKIPALHRWLDSYIADDYGFISFLLATERIWLNVNETSPSGETTMQKIYGNNKVPKYLFSKAVLGRGYVMTPHDEEFIKANSNDSDIDGQILTYKICSRVSDKKLVEGIFNFQKEIWIIESARQQKMIGFNFQGTGAWIAFANNAIEYHSEYWEYFELAFKYYGLWEQLISNDKKGSFHKKLDAFYRNMPQQRYDFDRVFKSVFKEFETTGLTLLSQDS